MRWKTPEGYKDGEERTVTTFLIFPMTLLNRKTGEEETRWLELVKYRQQYNIMFWGAKCWWSDLYWVDDD